MLTIMVALAVGILSGSVTGGVLGLWLSRRPVSSSKTLPSFEIDADVDGQIKQAAGAWASAHGRPESAGLVADKLRLVYALKQRRNDRRWL